MPTYPTVLNQVRHFETTAVASGASNCALAILGGSTEICWITKRVLEDRNGCPVAPSILFAGLVGSQEWEGQIIMQGQGKCYSGTSDARLDFVQRQPPKQLPLVPPLAQLWQFSTQLPSSWHGSWSDQSPSFLVMTQTAKQHVNTGGMLLLRAAGQISAQLVHTVRAEQEVSLSKDGKLEEIAHYDQASWVHGGEFGPEHPLFDVDQLEEPAETDQLCGKSIKTLTMFCSQLAGTFATRCWSFMAWVYILYNYSSYSPSAKVSESDDPAPDNLEPSQRSWSRISGRVISLH
ncbi:uncharacterized protein BO87DRAFT_381671 [Aspergillus neoniger CBS 115656]|uniref:Uncharacterized protein n=1 Tax=Aspergillus neoniger (strain CBS 115656) TaxID=1448310 RepID=A0A318YXE7_ASPNB|nr:hypothetical protein BO87DRAFT_381671 [Aspergillus neoniger CBS 115656]PYH39621.1 hypothetical protein BO87DRAFT_381671 [Aspergillus neoniger CBS 115656]